LGGEPAIKSVIDKFYVYMLSDNVVAPWFKNTDMDKQRRAQSEFITLVTGGPNIYHGEDMKKAHKGMNIGNKEFDATW
jgi:hemoglobin